MKESNQPNVFSRQVLVFSMLLAAALTAAGLGQAMSGGADTGPELFRVGERLTYNVSFERYTNVAYAEFYAESRGRLDDKDAVELKARFKTLNFVTAAFNFLDETRTTFAGAESGMPLYAARSQNIGGLPKETAVNFAAVSSPNLDLLTLFYKIRYSAGAGSLILQEGEKVYTVTFQPIGAERVRTDAGEYDTISISVQSEFLTDNGLKDLRINVSTDDAKIPAMIRFRTAKGEFRARLSSVQVIEPAVVPVPTPVLARTPRPEVTPRSTPAPPVYVENQPLATELVFDLGETLNYRISAAGREVGAFTLQAKERKMFQGADSLLLLATFRDMQPGLQGLSSNDFIRAQVDPETLAPRLVEIRFSGSLSAYNQSARFDEKGMITSGGGTNRIEAPVGTQSILSLVYALRSFNLKPSPNLRNPVNDTRVAVLWGEKPHIFTLRPSAPDTITMGSFKVPAQLISISTGDPQLDRLNIRLWLSTDERRVPLRFGIGPYQADLVLQTKP